MSRKRLCPKTGQYVDEGVVVMEVDGYFVATCYCRAELVWSQPDNEAIRWPAHGKADVDGEIDRLLGAIGWERVRERLAEREEGADG